MTVVVRALVLLVAVSACAADPTWRGHAAEDSWTTPPGVPLQLRVSRLEGPGTITAVTLPARSAESPSGPAVAGTRLSVTLDGIACEVAVTGRSTELVSRTRPASEEVRRPSTAAGTRELTFVAVELACDGQAVPGTDASSRGARSRRGIAWALLPLALAVIAGELARRGRTALAVALGAGALLGGAALAIGWFEGTFRVTYAVLYAGLATAGLIGMRGDSWQLRAALIGGAVIGAVIAPLLWPLWVGLGPIAALGFAAVGGALGAVAAVLAAE